jgi:hypothetical protein
MILYMSSQEKTLVIVLAETRAWEKTYDNFHANVLQPLNADLCVCIGVKPDYNYDNPFYRKAKYRFTYDEPANDDWASAFNYAEFLENAASATSSPNAHDPTQPTYDFVRDRNPVFSKLEKFYSSTENIDFLGRYPTMEKILEDKKVLAKNYEEIVYHIPQLSDPTWRYCAYGIKRAEKENPEDYVLDYGINLYKLRTPYTKPPTESWRRFLKIKNQFMGGILDAENQHHGSAAILIFFRWFLWKKLVESGAVEQYDRFVITRSDYIWRLEHPKLENLPADKIWVPNCETYNGITDRHTVIPRAMMRDYCGILSAMLKPTVSDDYYEKMMVIGNFNLEKLILFHLEQCGLANRVDFFPYVMFTIRPLDVNSRWGTGFVFHEGLQSYIKYISEDRCSQEYVNEYVKWLSARPVADADKKVQDFYREAGVIPATVRHYY